ncbi:hypothetical protein ECG_03222 [Echinococcus granulosus]|nr:hypothetical protein ECG_03222 [Echinococcus granulosus]
MALQTIGGVLHHGPPSAAHHVNHILALITKIDTTFSLVNGAHAQGWQIDNRGLKIDAGIRFRGLSLQVPPCPRKSILPSHLMRQRRNRSLGEKQTPIISKIGKLEMKGVRMQLRDSVVETKT